MKKLDDEEKDLMQSFDQGEWESIQDEESTKSKLKALAKASVQKNKRINIRISESDLNQIRVKALEEGIPYQTLISSVLHKFASSSLEQK